MSTESAKESTVFNLLSRSRAAGSYWLSLLVTVILQLNFHVHSIWESCREVEVYSPVTMPRFLAVRILLVCARGPTS